MRFFARSRLIAAALAGMAVWVAPVSAHAAGVDNFADTASQPFAGIYERQTADISVLSSETNEFLSALGPGFCNETAATSAYVHKTAWWKVQGNGRTLRANALGNGFATTVAVYDSGAAVFPVGTPASPTYLGCGYVLGHNQSVATWASAAGKTYWIQAGECFLYDASNPDPPCHEAPGFTTSLLVWIESTPPANDAEAAPTPLGASATADNNGATLAAGERSSCDGGVYDKTVWFRHAATEHGLLRVSIAGLSGVVTVLRATDRAVLGCGAGAATARVARGGDYVIQVGGVGYGTGASENAFTISAGIADPDHDNDTYLASVDCNDNNPAIHPNQAERRGNAVDEDCDHRALPFLSIPTDAKLSFGNGRATLRLIKVPAGSKLKIRCSRCSKSSLRRSFRRGRRRVVLSRPLGQWFRGAVVRVDVTKRRRVGHRWKWRMKSVPRSAGECRLVPGFKPKC
jgi:hypothetical protein